MTYRSLQWSNAYFYDSVRRLETVRRFGSICYLSSGVNHLRTPAVLREMAAREFMERNLLENYTSPGGPLAVVASITAELHSRLGPSSHRMIRPGNVCLTAGGTGALAIAFRYLAKEQGARRVLVLGLNYSFFSTVCDENGLSYSIIKSRQPRRILPAAEEAVERIHDIRPDVVVLTQPANPSGELYAEDELARVLRAIDAVGAWLVFDEVPMLASPDNPDLPAPTIDASAEVFPPRLIWVNSFSKSRSMAGLRVGYLLASPTVVEYARLANERQMWSPMNVATAALTTDMILRTRMRDERTTGKNLNEKEAGRYVQLLAPYGDDFSRFDTIWSFIDGNLDWLEASKSYREDLAYVTKTCERNWEQFRDRLSLHLEDEVPCGHGFNHCVKFSQERRERDFVRAAFDEAGIDFYTETVFADHDDASSRDFWVRVSCAIESSVFAEGVDRLKAFLTN